MSRIYVSSAHLFLLFLLLAGCAENRTLPAPSASTQVRVATYPVNRAYAKAVSDNQGKTVYAMNWESQEIDILAEGVLRNSIGGLGFERNNFQRLRDIGVDTDGSLLALDGAQKLLKKFTPEGMLVTELKFEGLNQPELFCVAPDGTIFIYDAAPSEIVCYSPLDGKEFNRFGRFELDRPVNLDCNRDYLWVHNREKQTTRVFYLLGQHIDTLNEIAAMDRQGAYLGYYILPPNRDSMVHIPPLSLTLRGDLVTVLWEDAIWLDKLVWGMERP